MKKVFLAVLVIIFVTAPLSLAGEKVKLPNFKKWPACDLVSYTYSTVPNGCDTKTLKELIEANHINLIACRYRSPDDRDIFVDLIRNIRGEPWLIFYFDDEKVHLFQRYPFFLFGHGWKYKDSLDLEIDDGDLNSKYLVIIFQVRNCLFFNFL